MSLPEYEEIYDFITLESRTVKDILSDPENIILVVQPKSEGRVVPDIKSVITLEQIRDMLLDIDYWFYSCTDQPRRTYVYQSTIRYVKLPIGETTIFVSYLTLLYIYVSYQPIINLKYVNSIPTTISHKVINNGQGRSGYHCQDGSSIDVYDIKGGYTADGLLSMMFFNKYFNRENVVLNSNNILSYIRDFQTYNALTIDNDVLETLIDLCESYLSKLDEFNGVNEVFGGTIPRLPDIGDIVIIEEEPETEEEYLSSLQSRFRTEPEYIYVDEELDTDSGSESEDEDDGFVDVRRLRSPIRVTEEEEESTPPRTIERVRTSPPRAPRIASRGGSGRGMGGRGPTRSPVRQRLFE